MSTKCTIAMAPDLHLYQECLRDFDVYLIRHSTDEKIRICSEEQWKLLMKDLNSSSSGSEE